MANNDYDKYIITINGKKREKFIRKGNDQQKNILLKKYPDAQLSTDEPGKQESSSTKKSKGQINETGPSQNNQQENTESNLEESSSESKPETSIDYSNLPGYDAQSGTYMVGNRVMKVPEIKDGSWEKYEEEREKEEVEYYKKKGDKEIQEYKDIYENPEVEKNLKEEENKVDSEFFKNHDNISSHDGSKGKNGWDYIMTRADGKAAKMFQEMYNHDSNGDGIPDFKFEAVNMTKNQVKVTAPNGRVEYIGTGYYFEKPNKKERINYFKSWMEDNRFPSSTERRNKQIGDVVDDASSTFEESAEIKFHDDPEAAKFQQNVSGNDYTLFKKNPIDDAYGNSKDMTGILREFALFEFKKDLEKQGKYNAQEFEDAVNDGSIYDFPLFAGYMEEQENKRNFFVEERKKLKKQLGEGTIDNEEFLEKYKNIVDENGKKDPYYDILYQRMKSNNVTKVMDEYIDRNVKRMTDKEKEAFEKDAQTFKWDRQEYKIALEYKNKELETVLLQSTKEAKEMDASLNKINKTFEDAAKKYNIKSKKEQEEEYTNLFKKSGVDTEETQLEKIETFKLEVRTEEQFLKGADEIKEKYKLPTEEEQKLFRQDVDQRYNSGQISINQANKELKEYESNFIKTSSLLNAELSSYQSIYQKEVDDYNNKVTSYINDQKVKYDKYKTEFDKIAQRNNTSLENYEKEIFELTGKTPKQLEKEYYSIRSKRENLPKTQDSIFELYKKNSEELEDLSFEIQAFDKIQAESMRTFNKGGLLGITDAFVEAIEKFGHFGQQIADGKDWIIDKGGDLLGLSEDVKTAIDIATIYINPAMAFFDRDTPRYTYNIHKALGVFSPINAYYAKDKTGADVMLDAFGVGTDRKESYWSKAIGIIDPWQDKTYRNLIERPYSLEEARRTNNWGLYTRHMLVDQLPILATMYLTGGGTAALGALSANASGGEYKRMQDAKDLYMRTGGLYGNDYSMAQMQVNSSIVGLAEGVLEYTTGKIMGKTINMVGGDDMMKGFTSHIKNSVSRGFSAKHAFRAAGGIVYEQFEEGMAESLTTVSQNLSQILVADERDLTIGNVFDGVDEAFISGALLAGALQSPRAFSLMSKPFSSESTRSSINKNNSKIADLSTKITNLKNQKNPDLKELNALETEYAELIDLNAQLIELDIKRVDLLHPSEKRALVEIEKRNENSRREIKNILADKNLTKEQKDQKIKEITNKVNTRLKRKKDIIDKYPPNVVNKNYKQQINTLKKMSKMAEKYGGIPTRVIIEQNEKGYKNRVKKYKSKEQGMTSAQVESNAAHFDAMIEGLNEVINDPESTQEEIQSAKELIKDAENQVRLSNNILQTDSYGVMQPIFEGGKIVGMDVVLNQEAISQDGTFGTAAHEFIHATFRNTLMADPEMREILGTQLDNILSGDDVQFKPGKRAEFLRKVNSYTIDKRGEEAMAIASEMMFNGDIKFNQTLGNKLSGVFRRFAQFHLKRDIEFNNQNDIKNFMIDYHKSIENNKVNPAIARMMARGAKGKMFKDARTKEQRNSESMFSLAIKKNLDSNPDLKDSFDDFVQNDDGSPKHRTLDDFRASPEFHEGYSKIVDSKLLDGLIRQGMTELGLPAEALKDFTRKVKEEVGIRYLSNYDVTKNDSLFGWLTGVSGGAGRSIIYRAKGDVMKQYTKEGRAKDVSIDRQIGEAGTIADIIKADKDALMDQIDNVDMTPTRKRDLKNTVQDLKMAMEILNLPNNIKKSIVQAVNAADVDLKGLSYKGIRDLLISTETKATTEKKATPTGPLFGVLNAIAAEFGIDPLRILAKQDLSSEQRTAAQKYIFNKAINEDGTLNKDFIEMLPEGQDRSGRSTGIANTKLGEFYIKGERAKMRAGATAAGLATQAKRTDITKAEFLNLFGINQDGTLQPGRKADGAIRELVVQISALTSNQQVRINAVNNSVAAESDIARIRDGMSESMFSEKLNNKEGSKQNVKTFKNLTKLEAKFQKKNLLKMITAFKGPEIDAETLEILVEGSFGDFSMIDLDADHTSKLTNEKTGITQGEYIKKGYKDIIKADPRIWQVLFYNMTGSIKRQSLMTKANFIEMFGQDPTLDKNGKYNEAKYGPPLYIPRIKYTEKLNGKPVQNKKVLDNYKESDYINKIPALIQTFKVFENILNTNPEYIDLVALMISDTVNNTGHGATRIAAPTYFAMINPVTGEIDYVTQVVEEHAAPQKAFVANVLFNAARTGNVDAVTPLIESYFKQGSLAEIDDKVVNQNFKSEFPQDFYNFILPKLQDGTYPSDLKDLSFLIRYSSPHIIKNADVAREIGVEVGDTHYINLNKYVVLAGKHKGKTFTEVFGVGMKGETSPEINAIQNKLISQVLTGEITREQAKAEFDRLVPENVKSYYQGLQKNKIKIENEIEQQRLMRESSEMMSSKKPPKVQGLSVFDFDDTLGITKSGVLVKVPNIDGDPKPNRKVIFLAGGAGSGKSNVVKKLKLEGQGFKIVNSDISLEWLKKNSGLPADMKDLTKEQRSTLGKLGAESRKIARRKMMKYQGNGSGVVIDGTGGSMKQMQKLVKEFQDKGYDVSMLFVETSLDTALDRNRKRKERTLLDSIVKRNHESVQNNKQGFKEMFGNNFMEVNTDNITIKDPMPTSLVSKMTGFTTSYEKLRIDATEFAEQGDALLEQGAEFDFTEFDQVVEGRPGPLLGKALERAKKYGTKDIFVLTARTQKSAQAIQQFLKSQGLDIPIQNITGLANSTGDAKAQWMLGKFAEGYNDMYFADDALQNVEAVKEVLDQLDVKSDVVQAKLDQVNRIVETDSEGMESKIIEPDINDPDKRDPIDKEFNDMVERKKKVDSTKIFTEAEARKRGSEGNIARFLKSLYVPPSAEDFKGLLYYFVGKGKQGDADLKFFKEKLLDPFAKGIRSWNAYKQNMVVEYKALRKKFKNVTKVLNEKVPGSIFTVDNAIRVYLYDKAGHSIPGISEAQKRKLIKHVESNPSLQAYADGLSKITRVKEGYPAPTNNWYVGSIPADMNNLTGKVGRKQFIQNWINNKDIIFSKDNLNKIRAVYGDGFADALENILYRMENGGNRIVSKDKLVNKWMDWINGSVGAIMFFNMRSALLQTISTVNFINWSDNNIFKAATAFANQPQFWKDFAMLFNSPMLKQRRAGLATDVSASELQRTFKEGGNSSLQKGQAVIRYLLQIGFTPTQIADSFAIALGGASFYRNRYKKYIKEGMSAKQANEQAMLDFQEVAEETQQSSREDLISQQQASVLGRMILAFQNVTMQMGRLTKKALSDLKNGRGDFKTNVSKIIYYGVAQNIIFASLQSALAMIMWGDDEEEITARTERAANQALDSFLRGTGIYGAIISTIKNTMIQWSYQKDAKFGREKVEKIILEAISISPPIGAKLRKIASAYYSDKYNEDIKMGIRVDNPRLKGYATLIEAVTNIPLARIMNKANNVEEALTGDHLLWQKAAMLMGWNRWDLGIKDEEVEEAKEEAKEIRKEKKKEEKKIEKEEKKKKEKEKEKKEGIKTLQCSGIRSNGERCSMTGKTKGKKFLCMYHKPFKDGDDSDGDGKKEYRCTATKSNGQRCKNKTENKNKKCYAHQ